jgi:hypothetical protein
MAALVRAQGLLRTFRCVGPDCVATCCRGWSIRIGPEATERWDALGIPPEERPALVGEGERTYMALDETGACRTLTPAGSCGLHERWGEAALARICSMFPRSPAIRPDCIQLTFDTGCPVVAEQVAASDEAVGWVDADHDVIPRPWARPLSLEPGHPAWALCDQLAGETVAVLLDHAWPLRTRLLRVAALGLLTADGQWPDREVAAAVAAPHVGLRRSLQPALLWVDRLLDWYRYDKPGPLAALRLQIGGGKKTAEQVDVMLERRERARELGADGPEAAWARLAVHGAQHNLPLDYEDPVLWVTEILLYNAAIRTLTLLHPDAPALLDAPDAAGWARCAADAAFRIARDIGHSTPSPDAPKPPWETAPEARTLAVLGLLAEP